MQIRPTLLWRCVFCACFIFINLSAAELSFEANRGQAGNDIRYLARTASGVIFVTDRGIALSGARETVAGFELSHANSSAPWTPENATGETISYFIGRDPSKWVEDAPHYRRLVRHNVYPGIDLILYGAGPQLEYDFAVAPHADPSQIRLKLAGARSVSIGADGALVVQTPEGELRHHKPVLMETLTDGSRRSIGGAFQVLSGNEAGFRVTGHDPALPLSIDPILEASTYFGGNGDDQVIATDGNGTLVGMTTSIDVPGAAFARPKGTQLFVQQGQQTMVIGCTGNVTVTSAVFGIQYSANPKVVAGGYTDCTDLPTNLGNVSPLSPSLQPNYAGGATDGFLLVIYFIQGNNPAYNDIRLSYIGGPGDDQVNAVAIGLGLAIAGSSTEGGLPQPLTPTPPYQSNVAGGSDAFLMILDAEQVGPMFLQFTTYLGGSGDDTALGVAFSNQGRLYIAGETKSPDFPLVKPLYSKREGDSDGFIAEISFDGTTLVASTLFGGGSTDSVVAATVLPSGNLAIAGVTSSTDLPLKNPIQKTYGGGTSDAFEAQFTLDLSTLVSSTYLGGSGADAATSITSGYPNTLYVGGWTASEDFPTVNAFQKKYGGGPDDGFMVHFDDDGSLYESTFFGGSGSDHVLEVTAASIPGGYYGLTGPEVWLVGTTTSPDLPVLNPTQKSLDGPSDGFVAEITADDFSVAPFNGGKDLRGSVTVVLGNLPPAGASTFTITTSDASKVQVAADATSSGGKSASLMPQANFGTVTFYADCLVDSGTAELTISAPGYKSKTIQATCFPQAILVGQQSNAPGPLQTNVGLTAVIFFSQVVNNPASLVISSTRPGAAPVIVQIANSNPGVGSVSATSITLTGNNNAYVTFNPLAIGSTDLTFSAGSISFLPSNTLQAIVGGTYATLYPFAVAAGFQEAVYLQAATPNPIAKLATVTSHDPARLALSLDPAKKGGASVTLSTTASQQPVCVQAFGSSGDVPLTISVPGEPDISTAVHLTTPVAVLNYGTNTGGAIQLRLGTTATAYFTIQGSNASLPYNIYVNPGASPITFKLQSSVADVVRIAPPSIQLTAGTSALVISGFQITAATVGSTVLTLENSANIPNAIFRSVTVNVPKKTLSFPDVEVGKYLIAPMTLTLPAPASSDVVVTATISDPTLALLSLDGKTTGLAQVTVIIPGGQSTAQFFVYGLAGSGQAKVTATLTTYGTVTANVNLDRSGFYWGQNGEPAGFGLSGSFYQSILVGPLDPASGLPVGAQPLQAGLTGTLTISNSNPTVASTDTQVPYPIGPVGPPITATAVGSTTLTLKEPAGFSTPSAGQQFVVNVPNPYLTLSLNLGVLGKGTQSHISLTSSAGTPSVTLISSDPSKVLLSANPNKLGSGSVTVTAGAPVYMQGMASSGTVTIKASASKYASVSQSVTLLPAGFAIALQGNNVITNQIGQFITSTQSGPATVIVNLVVGPSQQAAGFLLPGPALTANITSSNTAVAVVQGSPVKIALQSTQGSFDVATATLAVAGPGQSTISISQPAGFTSLGDDHITLNVINPSFFVNSLTVAKDTLTSASVQIPQGATPLTSNVTVTLTSSDPSRILLSPDATTPPTASISVTIAPNGSPAAGYYVHALSDNGTVTVQASAAGYSNTTSTVQLEPLGFGFMQINPGPIDMLIGGPQTMYLGAGPLSVTAPFSPTPLTLRPGVAPITIGLSTSDARVVSVKPPAIVFQGTINNTPVTFTPLNPGTATIDVTVPSAYLSTGPLTINANAPTINFSSSTLAIGDNLQTPVSFYPRQSNPNMEVTVTSSNPSLLVVSGDGSKLGESKVTLMASGGGFPPVFAQALSGRGNVTLFFSSQGYQTAMLPVTLTPSGAVFAGIPSDEIDLLTTAGAQQYSVALASLDPVTLQPGAMQSPRPGTNLSVAVTSSAPTVVATTTSTLEFPVQPQAVTGVPAGFQPMAAGTAVVTLGNLPGNPAPASQNQLVFNVSQP